MVSTTITPPELRKPGRRVSSAPVRRRVVDSFIVLVLLVVGVFIVGYVVADPVQSFAPPDATPEQLEQIRRSLGLDRPFAVQFFEYLRNLLNLDVGMSVWQQRPAMDAVLEVLPNTIILAVCGAIAASVVGITTGVIAGSMPGSAIDRVISFFSVVSISVANFWVGLLLIIVFAVNLDLFPTSGWYSWSGLVLPTATLAFIHGGRICSITRSVVIEEISKPYVLTATSRGLSRTRVVLNHVLRNCGLTIVTTAGWEFSRMLGGTIFPIEIVFGWPGLGPLMTTAAGRHDMAIVVGAVLAAGVLVMCVSAAVDVLGYVLDRTLRGGSVR